MKTLEEIKARYEKELKVEEDKLKAYEAIKSEGYEDFKLSEHAYMADYAMTLPEHETLVDAITTCEKMNPLTMMKTKGTFTSFIPEDKVDEYLKKNKGEAETVNPYIYEIKKLRQYPIERNIVFYAKIAGYLIKVVIPIKNDQLTNIDYKITFDRYGNAKKHYCKIINESGYFSHHVKWLASEEHPNNFTLY